LHERHCDGLFPGDARDMGYQPGRDSMASLLPLVTLMQKLPY